MFHPSFGGEQSNTFVDSVSNSKKLSRATDAPTTTVPIVLLYSAYECIPNLVM